MVPKLDCVELLTNDPSGFKYAAHFSFKNPNATTVYVPVGTNNYISTSGHYSGQLPTVFPPGTGQFKIYFDGVKMTWTLATYNAQHCTAVAAIASSTSTRCTAGGGTLQAGVEATSTTETMEASSVEPVASVYPNPTKDLVTINVQNASVSSSNAQIIDAFGRVSPANAKNLSDHSLQVDLTSRKTGVYFIRVLVDGEFKIFRVVKM